MAYDDFTAVMPQVDDEEEQRKRAAMLAATKQPATPSFTPVQPQQQIEAPEIKQQPYAPVLPMSPPATPTTGEDPQNRLRAKLIVNGMPPEEAATKASGYAPIRRNGDQPAHQEPTAASITGSPLAPPAPVSIAGKNPLTSGSSPLAANGEAAAPRQAVPQSVAGSISLSPKLAPVSITAPVTPLGGTSPSSPSSGTFKGLSLEPSRPLARQPLASGLAPAPEVNQPENPSPLSASPIGAIGSSPNLQRPTGPAEQRLRGLLEKTPPDVEPLHGWKKGLEIAGSIAAPRVAGIIESFRHAPETHYQNQLSEAEKAYQAETGIGYNAARLEHEQQGTAAERARTSQEEASGDLARQRIEALKDKPEDKFLYHDQDDSGNALAVFQGRDGVYTKNLGYQVGGKPKARTNPFEAFAYGTPEEKKSAQDFITFEKRQGAKNERPGEIEQRYDLYRRDPEAYKAMFGDRGAAQDNAQGSRNQAQAARMLSYFAKQRKDIEGDFTLDEATKQEKLAEIEDMEKPYRDAAQVGGTGGPGGKKNAGATNDDGPRAGEVAVIGPNGEPGYIPQENLAKALKRGYKQGPSQKQAHSQ